MSSPSPGSSPPANATAPPPANNTPSPPPANNTPSPPPANNTPSPPPATNTTTPPPAPSASPPPLPPSAPAPAASTPNATRPAPPPSPSPPPPGTPPPASPPFNDSTPPPPSSGHSPRSLPSSPPPPPPRSSGAAPPPPSRSRSPPSISSSPPPPPSSSSGLSTGVVVGIAAGGLVILLLLSIIFVCFCKKKRRRYNEPSNYYPHPPPPGPKADPFAVQQQQWQNNTPPSSYPPSSESSRPLHQPPPPPPPLFMNNSGGSASNYSASEGPSPSPGMGLAFSKSSFTYEELSMATNGFSDANLLGQGGFGYVHKGLLPNGKEIAVKQLKTGSGQGEREFQAEVEIISRVHHRHLVSLVGYCLTGSRRLLVYEFVPNSTLDFHLHGKGRPTMDWHTRLKIALGSAKGLAYLHEDCHPKIIHRDIKASNILLDFKFEAKVADFGLAKFTSDMNTHVSTRVMGTFGYLAPEYASSGKLTDKSDVFSFGVMLLELITGRHPVDSNNTYMDDSLVDWARPHLTSALEDGKLDAFVDPRLHNRCDPDEMTRMVACAAACVRHSARRRPRMSQIVRALEGDVSLADLNDKMKPGHSTIYNSHGSSDYDTGQYNEDMRKFRKMALGSTEYGSSEVSSRPTSEYGLNPSGSSSESQPTTRELEMGRPKKDSRGFSPGGVGS